MTSRKFWEFPTPLPLCHTKMAILITTLFRLSQKSEPPSPLVGWRHLWTLPKQECWPMSFFPPKLYCWNYLFFSEFFFFLSSIVRLSHFLIWKDFPGAGEWHIVTSKLTSAINFIFWAKKAKHFPGTRFVSFTHPLLRISLALFMPFV